VLSASTGERVLVVVLSFYYMRVWYVYNTVTLEWMAHTGWPPLVPSLNCWHGFAVAGYVRTSIHVMMLVARTNAEYRIAESHCLSLFWPHSVQCCQQNALVFATTLLSYAVMDALAILFDMRGHDCMIAWYNMSCCCTKQGKETTDTPYMWERWTNAVVDGGVTGRCDSECQ